MGRAQKNTKTINSFLPFFKMYSAETDLNAVKQSSEAHALILCVCTETWILVG